MAFVMTSPKVLVASADVMIIGAEDLFIVK